jgi:hypothetical protein
MSKSKFQNSLPDLLGSIRVNSEHVPKYVEHRKIFILNQFYTHSWNGLNFMSMGHFVFHAVKILLVVLWG